MRIYRALLRTGICIVVIGLSIFFANLTSVLSSSTSSTSFDAPANGACAIVTELQNRPHEIRILVPKGFNGTFYIFNYEGIKKLTEGTKAPTLEQTIEGSILIDFTPNRRGAYMFLIESEVSESVSGSIGLIEKEALNQDILINSTIIILFGFTLTLVAAVSKRIKF